MTKQEAYEAARAEMLAQREVYRRADQAVRKIRKKREKAIDDMDLSSFYETELRISKTHEEALREGKILDVMSRKVADQLRALSADEK